MINSAFLKPSEDILPELLLLGTLHVVKYDEADGKSYEVHYVLYEGIKYVMKIECVGRWYDERDQYAPKRSPFAGERINRDIFATGDDLKFV